MPITRINSLQNRRFRPKNRFFPANRQCRRGALAFLRNRRPLPFTAAFAFLRNRRPLPFTAAFAFLRNRRPLPFTAAFAFYGAAL
jgi:hypothetical protein